MGYKEPLTTLEEWTEVYDEFSDSCDVQIGSVLQAFVGSTCGPIPLGKLPTGFGQISWDAQFHTSVGLHLSPCLGAGPVWDL